MANQAITTDSAPRAIGPYSQAIKAGSLLFISGQLPIDPESGTLLNGSIEEQTKRIMVNLKSVVEAAGGRLDDLVKTTIFLTDLNSFAQVNQAYATFFSGPPPARSTVQVAALPLGSPVEIEAVAVLN
ncbi:RidA family protein [Desulfofustis limnaeus]|jgi:2-iminobutanoate/2-iminopropanoate deaminase|uniref:Reactive intermediate/imine deaminase n=1 Tax=Desulfofustis limnaeus TaxID=2740163 RepID=A0ABN6M9A7_9BACT|nr:RidA family protein [Desulfofustis limnaeus]MDX9896050.1 RidA family protein [Desulfofustis sp.]BDD89360.1 reactive intermediate/imine deaminase [Desulfofustis limnaeus]